jgi:signal recognition particle GTPase
MSDDALRCCSSRIMHKEHVPCRKAAISRRCLRGQVGAALSMVYSSGAPIMFVGCGQTYVDLTKLNVKSIVRSLLK